MKIVKNSRWPKKLTLKEILEYKPAQKAFDELTKANVDPKRLELWLCEISAAPTRRAGTGSLQAERRKVQGLANKARKLARQIEIAEAAPSKVPTG